jgi:agarase
MAIAFALALTLHRSDKVARSAEQAPTDTSGGEWRFADDFSAYPNGASAGPAWLPDSPVWQVSEGSYHCDSPGRTFAILGRAPVAARLSLRVTLTVKKAVSADWKIAGLSVFRDHGNYWHLALVEAPENQGRRHFFELCEMYRGVWLAQFQPGTTLTPNGGSTQELNWEYGTPYVLALELDKQGITGTVSGANGRVLARLGFRFDNLAVKAGRPALDCSGFGAQFGDFSALESQTMKESSTYPKYSGPAWDGFESKPSGFFRTQRRGGTWWVIDPKGRPFLIIGTDHANYQVHWCEKLGYAPYHKNVEKKYGSEDKWAKSTVRRLKRFGFNCLAANNSTSLRYQGLPHTEFLAFGQGFAGQEDIAPQVHWTGFPNVLSPKFKEYCESQAMLRCAPNKDDPWLIGYFLDNELEWYGKSGKEDGLFDEAFKKPREHSAKQALVDFLRSRYPSVEEMNAAWGTQFASFDALLESAQPPAATTDAARRDKRDFVRKIAELYFSITAEAVRHADPNHMILGCRFAGQAPGIWDLAGKYCDIVSVNCYRRVDLQRGVEPRFAEDLKEWYAQTKKPLMITEWSFPALDSGLPCTHGAGQRFDTQAQRARAFSIFESLLFSQPFIVGSDFFMWVDEPALGISSTFPEDSNYGLVNEQDETYHLLAAAAERVHSQAYPLHAARTAELTAAVDMKRGRFVVSNGGKAVASCTAEFWLDGSLRKKRLALAPDKVRYLPFGSLAPGGHIAAVVLDPEGAVPERRRDDNTAHAAWYKPGPTWKGNEKRSAERVPVVVYARAEALPSAVGEITLAPRYKMLPSFVTDANGARIPFQVDRLAGSPHLTFPAGPIGPYRCKTFFLCYVGSLTPQVEPSYQAPPIPPVEQGGLIVEKREANADILDRIVMDGVPLGRLTPLLWLRDPDDRWVTPSQCGGCRILSGPVASRIEVISREPGLFETSYLITIYRCGPPPGGLEVRMLWIKNLSARPLNLRAYYYYAVPFIGSSGEGDEVAWPRVPNYYRKSAAWADEKVGWAYGVLPLSDLLEVHFWKDDRGGFHPDARREIDVLLQPGQVLHGDEPGVVVFGARAGDLPAGLRALGGYASGRAGASWVLAPAERNASLPKAPRRR